MEATRQFKIFEGEFYDVDETWVCKSKYFQDHIKRVARKVSKTLADYHFQMTTKKEDNDKVNKTT
jgi:hypothetical protein